ncbi:HWE histidine kinase domain-containing protein [Phenylobacterium sp. J367]|uniref:HWE histidine kinase domain-containing protein n=1 Tax=Phenylobacterium sp. J367 TaxID=2898435 RepID=UPI002150E9E4|nr:HWE histidine kinase domain-containing protein [Phenylobacterium sp. J367]MCR5877783.1 PAS domain-containing protein [Phenylobacterium sp. J367]
MNHDRLELAIGAAGLGEFEWDVARDVFVVSERMASIVGLPPGEMPAEGGRMLDRYVHPEDMAGFLAQRERNLGTAGQYEAEFRQIRADDGRVVWVRIAGVVTYGDDGRPVNVTGIIQDITERKVEEEHRQTLMAELDHRVKNVLAAVQALAQQTAKRTTSLESFLSNFSGRLKALGSANELPDRRPLARRGDRSPGGRRARRPGAGPDQLGGARSSS